MDLSLQHLVDDLSRMVGRAAILEDHHLRLLAHSAHPDHRDPGRMDVVRSTSIVQRNASTPVASWLAGFALQQADRPVRVPANPGLGMLPRLCVPIRHADTTVGFLWFIDPEESLGPEQVDLCVREAATLGRVMYTDTITHARSASRVTEGVQMLLSEHPDRSDAGRFLRSDGYIVADQGVVVLVVAPHELDADSPEQSDTLVEALLTRVVSDSYRSLRRGDLLHLTRRDHVALLVACPPDPATLQARVSCVAAAAAAALDATPGVGRVVLGVGDHREQIADAAESYAEARIAVDSGASCAERTPVVHWAQLGVDRFIRSLAPLQDQLPPVHPGLEALLDDDDVLPLVRTLECYLDSAGNAQQTAEALTLHRTSLYYRLQRIETLAGADLKNGNDRLALHLALKLARASGRYDGGLAVRAGAPPATPTSSASAAG